MKELTPKKMKATWVPMVGGASLNCQLPVLFGAPLKLPKRRTQDLQGPWPLPCLQNIQGKGRWLSRMGWVGHVKVTIPEGVPVFLGKWKAIGQNWYYSSSWKSGTQQVSGITYTCILCIRLVNLAKFSLGERKFHQKQNVCKPLQPPCGPVEAAPAFVLL